MALKSAKMNRWSKSFKTFQTTLSLTASEKLSKDLIGQ